VARSGIAVPSDALGVEAHSNKEARLDGLLPGLTSANTSVGLSIRSSTDVAMIL